MITPLLSLPLRKKRDIVVARQRARQIARLLKFSPRDQLGIAATVFEMARRLLQSGGLGDLLFQMKDNRLQISPVGVTDEPAESSPGWIGQLRLAGAASLRVDLPAPTSGLAHDLPDVAWMVRQVNSLAPLDLFEEMHQQNLETLLTLRGWEAVHSEKPLPTAIPAA